MPGLTLRHPIRTLDHQLLLPPGAVVTQETIDALIDFRRVDPYPSYSLLSYGSIKEDFLDFLSTPPYETIFLDKDRVDVLKLLETTHFPIPILQSLDHFKQHDFHTYSHILMVFALSSLLARDLLADDEQCVRLFATGPTHDIGKVCVPLSILKKRTPLTQAERNFLEHHAAASYVLLSYYYQDTQHLACRIALDHHERRDGSGYPRGLLLRDSLVEIVAVSDIYDALIKPRSYRSAPYDNRTALEEMTEMAKQNKIGWDVVKALIAHNRKSKPCFREVTLSAEKRGTPPSYNAYGIIADETEPQKQAEEK